MHELFGSYRLAYPGAAFLPVLILATYLFRRGRNLSASALFPSLTIIEGVPRSLRLKLRGPVLFLTLWSAILVTSFAAARPQRVSTLDSGKDRNLVLCLDVSKSMDALDFEDGRKRITRMEGVKSVVNEFVDARTEDRIGLVVFGGQAFLQVPLTKDHNLVKRMVAGLSPGLAGDGTAIGDGLGLSLKRVQELKSDSKAIILMTDGVNNAGQVDPSRAADVAKDLGVKIHTIGIGSTQPFDPSMNGGFFGMLGGVQAEFDEETLKAIAKTTGGVYYNANSTEGLKEIYAEIDKLERESVADQNEQVVEEGFSKYALWGAFLYLLYLGLSRTIFLKVP